jgi:hypothetical protein
MACARRWAACLLQFHSVARCPVQGVCVVAMWAGTVWGALLVCVCARATGPDNTAPSKRQQSLARKIERSMAGAALREHAASVIAHWWRFKRFHQYHQLSPYESARHAAAANQLQASEDEDEEEDKETAERTEDKKTKKTTPPRAQAFGKYRRPDRVRRRRLMQTPLGVVKMPLILQDAFEQHEVNRMRSAMRGFKNARIHLRNLCTPGGEPEQLLVGLQQQINFLHAEAQSSLVVHAHRLAGRKKQKLKGLARSSTVMPPSSSSQR